MNEPNNVGYQGYGRDASGFGLESEAQSARAKAEQVASDARAKAEQVASDVKDKIHRVGERVNDKADAALTAVGSKMNSVAGSLRGSTPSLANAAERTAETLESAGNYLKNADAKDVLTDVGHFVKRHPVPAMLGAAAVGFALARSMRR